MENYPLIQVNDRSLSVEFSANVKLSTTHPLDMALDFDEAGEVVGIEILNLVFEAGKNCLGIIGQTVRADGYGLKYSYDEDSDSFYLRLKAGLSFDQKAVHGSMCRDVRGQIVAFSATWL